MRGRAGHHELGARRGRLALAGANRWPVRLPKGRAASGGTDDELDNVAVGAIERFWDCDQDTATAECNGFLTVLIANDQRRVYVVDTGVITLDVE